MRVFAAIELQAQLKEKLLLYQEQLRQNWQKQLRFVKPELLHLTLRFFGEISQEQLAKISAQLKLLCAATENFDLSLGDPGYFAKNRKVQTLWVGLSSIPKALEQCWMQLDKLPGQVQNQSRFQPHITVARCKQLLSPLELEKKLPRGQFEGMTQTANKLNLIESELTRSGPIYRTIESFSLQEKSA